MHQSINKKSLILRLLSKETQTRKNITMIHQLSRELIRRGSSSARTSATVSFRPAAAAAGRCFSSGGSIHWSEIPMGPPDAIIGLTEAYKEDMFEHKVNVGVGAYRSDEGAPYVLPCVREAESILMGQNLEHEYSGIAGDPDFVKLSLEFVYGTDSKPLIEKRVAAVQTLSGTGGLRVFGEFLARHGHKHIYLPNPTWGNHIPIFQNAGLEVRKYRYYDTENSDLDYDNMSSDIKDVPEGSCVLFHACAHNPTG
mmetsp:Transcript_7566/g.11021  ORF Transcript_7566/g.11021 Transcript_7566/m.11021 type:complete len:254 (-) Transcript_7566:768-1529(-)